jgi:hypothetical protein
MTRIKWLYRLMLMSVGIWATLAPWARAENQGPAEGAPLPAITLPAPKDAAHQVYLGLTGKKEFTIADISAEVVIIEIMNMY